MQTMKVHIVWSTNLGLYSKRYENQNLKNYKKIFRCFLQCFRDCGSIIQIRLFTTENTENTEFYSVLTPCSLWLVS